MSRSVMIEPQEDGQGQYALLIASHCQQAVFFRGRSASRPYNLALIVLETQINVPGSSEDQRPESPGKNKEPSYGAPGKSAESSLAFIKLILFKLFCKRKDLSKYCKGEAVFKTFYTFISLRRFWRVRSSFPLGAFSTFLRFKTMETSYEILLGLFNRSIRVRL